MKSPRPRRGSTLLEVLVATAVFSLLLGTAAVCLHSLHRADAQLREQVSAAKSLSWLSLRLRSDAHDAVDVRREAAADDEPSIDSVVLLLEDDESIEYRAQPGQILRFARKGDALVQRERYRLPHELVAAWAISEDRGRRFVGLTIHEKATTGETGPLELLRFDAVVGGGDTTRAEEQSP